MTNIAALASKSLPCFSNSKKLLSRTISLVAALTFASHAAFADAKSPTSVLECKTYKGEKCVVDSKGNQACTPTTFEKCTVVSGPGSGKPTKFERQLLGNRGTSIGMSLAE